MPVSVLLSGLRESPTYINTTPPDLIVSTKRRRYNPVVDTAFHRCYANTVIEKVKVEFNLAHILLLTPMKVAKCATTIAGRQTCILLESACDLKSASKSLYGQ